ncbi:YczE/YyaS/YitT family protein [Youngiibacter multivorans]|uniref:Membrane protein YczE n=1 Tax=Youngiibacter multivorans TaxID=937251 RepID=A0ABS4G6W2_9CLOT|nr:DUF6198 family protein [Youngiibacter multivorans]MBP1920271.1 putative membrane protein YczE [Youngiibacter multivorans]
MLTTKRFFVFIIGLLVLSFGIALSIRSGLGISPVSSVSFVLSRIIGISVGNTTTAFYSFCVLLQLFILKKDFKLKHFLQVVFSFVFGKFTDLSLFITRAFITEVYIFRVLMLFASLVIIALGVYTVVLTDIVMIAPDGLVKAIADHWSLEFSQVKSTFDIICVSISAILSLVFLGSIQGLREGTLILALSIGRLIGIISRNYKDMITALYI